MIWGTATGVIERDTKSLDYGSFGVSGPKAIILLQRARHATIEGGLCLFHNPGCLYKSCSSYVDFLGFFGPSVQDSVGSFAWLY